MNENTQFSECKHLNVKNSNGYCVCQDCGECISDIVFSCENSIKNKQNFPLVDEKCNIKFKLQIFIERFNKLFDMNVSTMVSAGGYNTPSILVEDLFDLLYNKMNVKNFDLRFIEVFVYGILLYVFKNRSIRYLKRDIVERVDIYKINGEFSYLFNSIIIELNELRDLYNPVKQVILIPDPMKVKLESLFSWLNKHFKIRYAKIFWWASFYQKYFPDKASKFKSLNCSAVPLRNLAVLLEKVEKKYNFQSLINFLKSLNGYA